MCNQEIRNEVKRQGLYLWQVAAKLGINDCNFSRKLRFELSEAEKGRVMEAIRELREERERENG